MGALSVGAVVALYNYMSQILIELIKMANLVINVTKSVACANRIAQILQEDAPEYAVLSPGENELPAVFNLEKDAVTFSNVQLR